MQHMYGSCSTWTDRDDEQVEKLLDLPQDALLSIAESLLNDDKGTQALAQLCGSCSMLRCFGKDIIAPFVSKLAFDFCHVAHIQTIEEYAVVAALSRIGGTQLTFRDAGADLKPGKSYTRVEVFARLLQRHPTLVAHIEGHAGVNAPDRAAAGFSLSRAKRVGVLLAARCCPAARLRMQGWGKSVSRAAQWPAGAPSRRVDVFFTLGRMRSPPLFLPPRPPCYSEAEECHTSVSPVDRFFFDEVAQELMTHPKLQAAFRRLHGLPMDERQGVMAAMVDADPELVGLFATLKACAGDSVSVARGEPSAEELRVARYVNAEPEPEHIPPPLPCS